MANAVTTKAMAPGIQALQAAPVIEAKPPIHGAMSRTTATAACAHSATGIPGTARLVTAAATSKTPSVSMNASDAPPWAVHNTDNAA